MLPRNGRLLIVAVVAYVGFSCLFLQAMGRMVSHKEGEEGMKNHEDEEKEEERLFDVEVQKLQHQLDVNDANKAQLQQGHDRFQHHHALAADVGTKFDDQMAQPLFKLVDNGMYEGSLTIVNNRELQTGEDYASGQTLFQLGKIQNPSPMGYIEDVW